MRARSWSAFWLAVVLSVIGSILVLMVTQAYVRWRRSTPASTAAPTLTKAQLARVRDAIDKWAGDKGHRPAYLEELAAGGYLRADDLFDKSRRKAPAINAGPIDPAGADRNSGRFAVCPDVIYFPAVRPDDPADMLMLATVIAAAKGDKLLAVRNDGTIEELTPLQMVTALQRTYAFIGERIQANKRAPATSSAPAADSGA